MSMTTEELAKRRAWAESHFGDKNLTDEELECATYMPSENFSDGWDKGSKWVLSSIWKDPKNELPEKYEWVYACICRMDNSIKYMFEVRHEGNGIFLDDDGLRQDYISYWMRVPETPKLNP